MINFPNSPSLYDEHTDNNGTVWVCSNATGPVWAKKSLLAEYAKLASPAFTGNTTLETTLISNDTYPQTADSSIGSGTHTFDATIASEQQLTITGNITLAFTFTTNVVSAFIIDAVNWGDYVVTFPVGMLFSNATAPTFTAGGRDKILVTHDKDNVLELFVIGQNIGSV